MRQLAIIECALARRPNVPTLTYILCEARKRRTGQSGCTIFLSARKITITREKGTATSRLQSTLYLCQCVCLSLREEQPNEEEEREAVCCTRDDARRSIATAA